MPNSAFLCTRAWHIHFLFGILYTICRSVADSVVRGAVFIIPACLYVFLIELLLVVVMRWMAKENFTRQTICSGVQNEKRTAWLVRIGCECFIEKGLGTSLSPWLLKNYIKVFYKNWDIFWLDFDMCVINLVIRKKKSARARAMEVFAIRNPRHLCLK